MLDLQYVYLLYRTRLDREELNRVKLQRINSKNHSKISKTKLIQLYTENA